MDSYDIAGLLVDTPVRANDAPVRASSESVPARGGCAINAPAHKDGAYETYTLDKSAPATKDETIITLIPDVITECRLGLAVPGGVCASEQAIAQVRAKWGNADATASASADTQATAVLTAARAVTGCATERCVIEKTLTGTALDEELAARYKVAGPTGTALLSNINIDAILQQWAAMWPEFYAYNFNMRNYAAHSFVDGRVLDQPDTLATIGFDTLLGRGFTCAACVINTDVYQGGGKHWMALFVDARSSTARLQNAAPTVEFFNSSGNNPQPEFMAWLVKTQKSINDRQVRVPSADATVLPAKIVCVTKVRQQHSKTECGVYALFYIWARLNGVSWRYFCDRTVPDQLMFEFRQHLFHDTRTDTASARFDWREYSARNKIEWE